MSDPALKRYVRLVVQVPHSETNLNELNALADLARTSSNLQICKGNPMAIKVEEVSLTKFLTAHFEDHQPKATQ